MMAYIKCGRLWALHFECDRVMGASPFFSINSCNSETIIDLPFSRIILTPGRRLESGAQQTITHEDSHHEAGKHPGKSAGFFMPASRTSEN